MKILGTALCLLALTTSAFAQDCKSDPHQFWICEGDNAWVNGYLVDPETLDLRECMQWEAAAELIPEIQDNLALCIAQRDEALKATTQLEEHTNNLTQDFNTLSEQYQKLQQTSDDKYTTIETIVITSITGVVALGIGTLIGGLAL